jgi:magnesium-transporting ATPase (P-type)
VCDLQQPMPATVLLNAQAANATVVRGGRVTQVPAGDLVPGDIIEVAGEPRSGRVLIQLQVHCSC